MKRLEINKLNESLYEKKLQVLKDYLFVKRQYKDSVFDGDFLLDILHGYFEILAYTDRNDTGQKVIINLEKGDIEVNINKGSNIILSIIFFDISKIRDIRFHEVIIELDNHAINYPLINFHHKCLLIHIENEALKDYIENHKRNAQPYFEKRINIIMDVISKVERETGVKQIPEQNMRLYYSLLSSLMAGKNRYLCFNNKSLYAFSFLRSYLEEEQQKNPEILRIMLFELINLNNKYLFENPSKIESLINYFKSYFSKNKFAEIKSFIQKKPSHIEFKSTFIQEGNIGPKDIEEKRTHTIIQFTIPHELNLNRVKLRLEDKIILECKNIENYLDDPIFRKFNTMNLGGISLNMISDAYSATNKKSTTIIMTLQNFYHPDFEIENGSIKQKLFEEKEALIGRPYNPYKEFIIENLREHYTGISRLLKIKKDEIKIDLFSNFILNYIKLGEQVPFFSRFYFFTNPDSFSNASKRFLDKINELNLKDSWIGIRKFVTTTVISDDKALNAFMYKLLEIIVKKNIENHKNYQYYWKKENEKQVPQSEPYVQPHILSQLKAICEFIGIQISRESESGNGSIDFLCTYTTSEGILTKTVIELKNAHNSKIEKGLTSQLPEYLKAEGTKFGIYMVLWYKGSSFNYPTKYEDIEHLKSELESLNPKSFKVKIIIVDCTKPISPSKL
jgi:hypothetical protein